MAGTFSLSEPTIHPPKGHFKDNEVGANCIVLLSCAMFLGRRGLLNFCGQSISSPEGPVWELVKKSGRFGCTHRKSSVWRQYSSLSATLLHLSCEIKHIALELWVCRLPSMLCDQRQWVTISVTMGSTLSCVL